uniref:HAT C-terminal dimerisation domain-containing protein n=1 Tax=Setaria italica TaxID=4555 RepID=K3ZM33_SETIT
MSGGSAANGCAPKTEYGFLVDPNNKDKVECKFCGHRSQGGVHRLKEHVANVGTNAKKCKKSTQEAKDKCKKSLEDSKRKRKEVVARELELREEVNVSRVGGEDEEQQTESLQQQKLNKEVWKERTHEVHKYIARWVYTHAIPFNACDNDEFKQIILEKKDQLRNMVVHNRWDTLKDVIVFEPLVKVLCLVDGDVKPSMGFLYGELLKVNREIKEAYGNVQSRYNEVIAIIDKKMKGRLDSPLHLTTYLLNPYYSYGNLSIFDKATITEGFISCVETFYHHDEKQDEAVNTELKKFQNREGNFNKKLARSCEKIDYNPASWWRLYETEAPALQKLATRILSLTSSSSGCEGNWSTFEMIHTKKRNRLTTTRLNKLVFVQFNSKLINKKERIMSKKTTDVLLSSETTEAQGFLYEDGDNCATVVYRDEEDEEMEGTGIPWSVIGDAVGADQQLELRRSARVR